MKWLDFNTAVRVYLPSHNRRQGIQPLINALITAGTWDLCAAVPQLRSTATREILPADFTASGSGYSALTSIDAQSRILDVYCYHPDEPDEHFPFEIATTALDDSKMETGRVSMTPRFLHYTPKSGVIRVTPSPIEDGTTLVVEFDNARIDYEDTDDVPFDEKCAEAVAYFVAMRLAVQVDHSLEQAATFRALYIDNKRKLRSELNPALLVPVQTKEA